MTNISDIVLIAHRGLLKGPSKELENNPENIIFNIRNFPKILNEIDINILKNGIYTGHDQPQYEIDIEFILENVNHLILHIKKIEYNSSFALEALCKLYKFCHCFSHEEDCFTITNKGFIWSHPRMGFRRNTIFVMPEKVIPLSSDEFINNLNLLRGVCTDFPLEILQILNKDHIDFSI